MRFYKILFYSFLLFLVACQHDPKPDNLIDQEQFIPLLVDIHLADGYLTSKSQLPDSLSYRGNGLYAVIFKKYGVDSVAFINSFKYYSRHLNEMSQIYKEVVDRLTAKNDSVTKHLAAEEMQRSKLRNDSVKKVFKIDSSKQAVKRDSVKKTNTNISTIKAIANHK